MNRNIKYLFLVLLLIFLNSCVGLQNSSYGLENQAYIKIIGDKINYPDQTLYMVIDHNVKTLVLASKDNNKKPSGELYRVSPGKHEIIVYSNENIIIRNEIFVSSQEIKKIYLP